MLLILFLTLGILLNVIVHAFLIYNECSLALSHSKSCCISIFKLCSFFGNSVPWIHILVSSAYIIRKVICDTAFKSFIVIRNSFYLGFHLLNTTCIQIDGSNSTRKVCFLIIILFTNM